MGSASPRISALTDSMASFVDPPKVAAKSQNLVGVAADGALHDQELFEQCVTSPLIFASAMLNFGVHQILDTRCAIAPAPTPEWGLIIAEGRDFMATAWWLIILPGLAIVAVVVPAP